MIDHIKLTATTDAAGAATVTGTVPVVGKLLAIEWIDGTFADGVDAVISITSTSSGVDHTILTLSNANDDAWYYPRVIMHDNAGVAVTLDGTNEAYVEDVLFGFPKLVVANGGDSFTGGCVIYFER